MKQARAFVRKSFGAAWAGMLSFGIWTLWLGLTALLIVQLYVVSAREISVPGFVTRRLEAKLAESGVSARFAKSSIDPRGTILIEDVEVFLTSHAEPVASARAAYVRLNPWMLLLGQFEPREIRLSGGTVAIPAMFSPTGRPDPIIRDVEGTVAGGGNHVDVRHLTLRFAGVAITGQGRFRLPARPERPRGEALQAFLRDRFPALCRQATAAAEKLAALDRPSIRIEVSPSASGSAVIDARIHAARIRLSTPFALEAQDIRGTTRLLLFGDAPTTQVDLEAAEVRLPGDTRIQRATATVRGRFAPGGTTFEVRDAELTAESLVTAGVDATSIAAQIFPQPLPRLDAHVTARVLDGVLAASAKVDVAAKSALVHLRGSLAPRLLDPISARAKVRVQRFFDFAAIECDAAEVRVGPGWKIEEAIARLRLERVNGYGVIFDEGRATLTFDGQRVASPEVWGRVGANYARGSYEHDLRTHQYRFLLDGRLRPMDISPWFQSWWPNFFRQLEFPQEPPPANVEVSGQWRYGRRTSVFVFADTSQAIIRGAPFDRVRTRLFIRPGFFDVLEVFGTHGTGAARGHFTYTDDLQTDDRRLELSLQSTVPLHLGAKILGSFGAEFLAPFEVQNAPAVNLSGWLAFPGRDRAASTHELMLSARTSGESRFQQFPLHDLSFRALFRNGEITVEDLEATLATGVVGGRARVWGAADARRLGFDIAIKDASFGQVVGTLQEFLARRAGRQPEPPGKFVRERANVRIDVAASAEGLLRSALSFNGRGNFVLAGAEIGEVALLGKLSELLRFTALSFNDVRGDFRIEAARLNFPNVTARGSDAVIEAKGDYALDRQQLDFNARVFPFQESGNLIKTVVGAVLTPLSNVLEVRLTGTLAKPDWAFVIGPTNLLRSIAEPGSSSPASPPVDRPPPVPPEEPPPETVSPSTAPASPRRGAP